MFRYEGFSHKTPPLTGPAVIGAVPPRFGLLDVSDARWTNLMARLQELNAAGAGDDSYKLIFFGRHGEGYHNVAEAKYGTEAWNDYWSKLDSDGELTWAPDPELTAIGKAQAVDANAVWKTELAAANMPLPGRLYCSPMTRAIQTNVITFEGVSDRRAVILENCREEYGSHTCDIRRTRTQIHTAFPQFEMEDGFTEEDELWTEERESKPSVAARATIVLERIFREDEGVLFVSITAHGGIINGFLHAVGRPRYVLPTGGVLPIVVKATRTNSE
ncbi:F-box domain-containing protein [Mycena venus]|uniref:F-box domain-containing protein n=1 Tax=Mycena venus TaxID=2733690 RepID=A0A8H7DBN6_9AGAR|nr:F-box domain-containing protein [Mycena venus]